MNVLTIIIIVLLILAVAGFFALKGTASRKEQMSAVPGRQEIKEAKKLVDATLPKAFKKEMRLLDSQTERMEKKSQILDESLKSYFGDSSISYDKFARTVAAVQNLFLDNTKKIITRINVFDEDGYKEIHSRHLEYTSAIDPYKEHFKYVNERLEDNEMILQKMDRLLLEVNKLNDSQVPIDEMPIMQEINELIEQTKLYQQN